MGESSEAFVDFGFVNAVNAIFHGGSVFGGVGEALHVDVSTEEGDVELVSREVVRGSCVRFVSEVDGTGVIDVAGLDDGL